jgi:HPt (histidine-containing phosphotransfer) domain-containing protein
MIASGFDDVLVKPFKEHDMLRKIGIMAREKERPDKNEYFNNLNSLCGGDSDLVLSILGQFVEETTTDLQELYAALDEKNKIKARNVIHRLAGRTGQIGALDISKQLRTIEIDLQEDQPLQIFLAELSILLERIEELNKEISYSKENLQLNKSTTR